MGEGVLTCVEYPVQNGQDASAGMGIINRRAKDEAVGRFGFCDDLIDDVIIKDTSARQRFAGAAGGTVPDRFIAQEQDFRLDPRSFQYGSNLPQSGIGAAVQVRTSIEQ